MNRTKSNIDVSTKSTQETDNQHEVVESFQHLMVEHFNEYGWGNASDKFEEVMEGLLSSVWPAVMKSCRELMEFCEAEDKHRIYGIGIEPNRIEVESN